jgi:hypothetical protein
MGYAMVTSPCVVCKALFAYNPHRVPSIRRHPDGPREPVCARCMREANDERARRGMPLLAIDPEAYNPIEESEL